MAGTKAVLLMAYGTPYQTGDIMDYYTNIRHGSKPSADLYNNLKDRYDAIGGTSPLADLTNQQAKALQTLLDKDYPGKFKVYVGLKYITPFIGEAVDQIAADGITDIYGVPLAPQYSTFSSGDYHNRAKDELKKYPNISYTPAKSWWKNENLLNFWSQQLVDLKGLTQQQDTRVILSAHSLPLRVIKGGDPYKGEVINDAKTIAQKAGLNSSQYTVGWQSAGRTEEEWIGPDFIKTAEDLIKENGVKHIISGSIGFITDNLEILYDVDIELKDSIEKLGGQLTRLRLPNTDPLLIKALEETVLALVNK